MLKFEQVLLGIFIFMPFITLIHELGHVFFGKLFNINILSVTLGIGPILFKVRNLKIRLLYFFYGFTEYEKIDLNFHKQIIFLLGGIIFNLLSIFILRFLIYLNIINRYIFVPFITFSEVLIILSILPIKYFNKFISDSLQIYNLIKSTKIDREI